MKNTAPGSTLTYDYLRRSGIENGPTVRRSMTRSSLRSSPAPVPTAAISAFRCLGSNRIPAGPFTDMPGQSGPELFLENHLKGLASLLEANPRYIKNAIRKSLRDNATVTPTEISFKGKTVEGWRVEIKPFASDQQSGRMRGFDTITYTSSPLRRCRRDRLDPGPCREAGWR